MRLATEDTQLLLSAIKEQGGRTEKIIGDLVSEIREQTAAIAKGFAAQRVMTSTGSNGWRQFAAVAGVIAAVMTPTYIWVKDIRDDVLKHEALSGHADVSERISTIERSMVELDKLIVWKEAWVPRVRSLDSTQTARQNFLWMEVFGDELGKSAADQ